MSTLLTFATPKKQSRSNLLASWLAGGTVELYAGDIPADADEDISDQTMLAEFILEDPAGVSTDGVFTGTMPEPALILSSAVATWGRMKDSLGDTIGDVSAGLTGSGMALTLDNTSLTQGGLVAVVSFVIAEG